MRRILGLNGFNLIQTWADVSYAQHQDIKSHTGGAVLIGHEIIHHKAGKHKKNMKISDNW